MLFAAALFSSRMCVAQLYMSNPYLLGGPKRGCAFRLRAFALVTSVHPHLRAFLYREGVSPWVYVWGLGRLPRLLSGQCAIRNS